MPNLIIGGAELITKIWYFHRKKIVDLKFAWFHQIFFTSQKNDFNFTKMQIQNFV